MTREEWLEWLNFFINIPENKQLIKEKEASDKVALISPAREYWFRPLFEIDITTITVVLIGARPYYDLYASDGICFSSLDYPDRLTQLLYTKIEKDIGVTYDTSDNTKDKWIEQGVLPISMQQTVISGKENDKDESWLKFSRDIIIHLLQDNKPRFFVFFDSFSKRYKNIIKTSNIHNYPLLFCDLNDSVNWQLNIFAKINKFIENHNYNRINWI